MRPRRLTLFALLAAGGAVIAAPQQRPVFRTDVGMVPVFASVSDGQGGFILDLKASDFEVRDNGRVQEIAYFTTDTQPLSTLILIDGSTSMTPVYDSVIEAASSFVLRMLPADRAAVASFADVFRLRQHFTSNRDELLKHLADPFSIRMGLETRLWDALVESVRALGKEEGRRVVLAITDGVNWTAGSGPLGSFRPNPGDRWRTVLSEAIARDVMIYAAAMWSEYEGKPEPPSSTIIRLAEETGGGYVELRPATDMNATFTAVMEELHRQYVLGFVPQALDGKEHRLEVRVKRPGTKVRARRSYKAPGK
jgi:VWFA-related protein